MGLVALPVVRVLPPVLLSAPMTNIGNATATIIPGAPGVLLYGTLCALLYSTRVLCIMHEYRQCPPPPLFR